MECSITAVVIGTLLTGSSPCAPAEVPLGTFDYRGVRAEDVVTIFQNEGYKAKLGVDNFGDPMIETSLSGITTDVFFYDCDDGYCKDIQFHAGWDFEQPLSQIVIAAWNEDHRFGKAHLDDEGDPLINVDLQVSAGGTAQLIASYNELTEIVFSDFEDHIFDALEAPDVYVPGQSSAEVSSERDI